MRRLIFIDDKKLLVKKIFFLLLICRQLDGFCQQSYWQQEVHYRIDVSLNDVENTLDGFANIEYINHSPDTLRFIWFHVWPNAYKNDRTAFSEQLLENGRTDFYFSDKDQKGYINRLDFQAEGMPALVTDHPLYLDIIKVSLPMPLAPGAEVHLSTSFHEKIPFNFSRGGYQGQSYQITQWYPKPAVYDRQGWHPIPYLDQGEFYGEFGSYDVRITLPKNYVVAATGILQNQQERQWLVLKDPKNFKDSTKPKAVAVTKTKSTNKKYHPAPKPASPVHALAPENIVPPSDTQTKTLQFIQDRVHDFAWFADKRFLVAYDTIRLASGKVIDAYCYYPPADRRSWKTSLQDLKDAVHFRSSLVGEYPYDVVSVVDARMGFSGGMEYPTITNISGKFDPKQLDGAIEHEVGHNWFYGILGSNERRYPWMDEGINTYYDNRYMQGKYPTASNQQNWMSRKVPDDLTGLLLQEAEKEKTDQPISTSSEAFSLTNYDLVAYYKAGQWLKQMEAILGTPLFDSCMQAYFKIWQFRHPYPQDFSDVLRETSGKGLQEQFEALDKTGPLAAWPQSRKIRPAFLFSLHDTRKYQYINFLPAFGYNLYDQFMLGIAVHNYGLPSSAFQFFAAPLYATGSHQLNGLASLKYAWYPDLGLHKIEAGLGFSRFSSLSGTDSNGSRISGGFYKLVPSLRLTFRKNNPRSSLEKWIDIRTFLIGEKSFDYFMKSTDSLYYPSPQPYSTRYLNQVSYNVSDFRALYPYDYQLQLQQGSAFYRLNLTARAFFNYEKGGGLNVRFFAAKFGYLGEKTLSKEYATTIYQPKLTAVRGDEDYTYSNYFIGRNESTGAASQQIMMKDGGLKLRTDLFQGLQGRSDNWIMAANFNTTLPSKIVPGWLPLKIFFDIGTYADAWTSTPPTSKFLYVGGLQISVLQNLINIYIPLVYSSDFANSLKTTPDENTFFKKISFSFDIQDFRLKKIFRNIPY